MGILLAFAPFLVFIVVERLVGVTAGLAAATVTSAGLLVRDALSRKKTIKVLEVGTFLLFGGLTAYTVMVKTAWSIPAVRLWVDAGLLGDRAHLACGSPAVHACNTPVNKCPASYGIHLSSYAPTTSSPQCGPAPSP